MIKKTKANIFINNGWHEAELHFNQRFTKIDILGDQNPYFPKLIPGFIDLHVHGGGGVDLMEGQSAASVIARTHAQFGTTSWLATTMTAPFDELHKTFQDLALCATHENKKQAHLLGVHLEGPFISADKLGAQPNFVREATLKEIKKLHDIFPIKIITLAPELFSHLHLIKDLTALGIIVQIGHTNGSYEQGLEALNMGAKSFTHLYNAMSAFHHRAPGMAGAALAHAQFAELIPDLIHVHPGAIKAALRAIPNLYFVTDATSASGMPDGDYNLGAQKVHKCLGGVRLADGTLAGSALTMDVALLNLLSLGLSLEEASWRLSEIPARLIGCTDRGNIAIDSWADFLILNKDHTLKDVYLQGELL